MSGIITYVLSDLKLAMGQFSNLASINILMLV